MAGHLDHGRPADRPCCDGWQECERTRALERARELYAKDGEIEVDDVVSRSDDPEATGCYVAAWLWVPDDDPSEDGEPMSGPCAHGVADCAYPGRMESDAPDETCLLCGWQLPFEDPSDGDTVRRDAAKDGEEHTHDGEHWHSHEKAGHHPEGMSAH